jgi:hypothetical protein
MHYFFTLCILIFILLKILVLFLWHNQTTQMGACALIYWSSASGAQRQHSVCNPQKLHRTHAALQLKRPKLTNSLVFFGHVVHTLECFTCCRQPECKANERKSQPADRFIHKDKMRYLYTLGKQCKLFKEQCKLEQINLPLTDISKTETERQRDRALLEA